MEPSPPAPPHPSPAPLPVQADPYLIAFLADRDLPCPACTYNLRGLQSDRCPECNRELELQIRLTEPKQGAWVAAIVGASVMAGFHVLLLGYFLFMKLIAGKFGPPWSDAWPLLVFAPLGGVLLLLLVKKRRAFCNMGDGPRWAWGFIIPVAAVMSAMLFFAIIR